MNQKVFSDRIDGNIYPINAEKYFHREKLQETNYGGRAVQKQKKFVEIKGGYIF